MKTLKVILCMIVLFNLFQCGGVGGTEVGTTSALTTNMATVAKALVPNISASSQSSSLSKEPAFLTYGTSDDWAEYMDGNNLYIITDVFGPADEGDAVVTKIRVLIDQFKTTLAGLIAQDSNFSCSGNSSLNEEDTLAIAFYGNISNGTSEDRYYDCLHEVSGLTGSDESVILYGLDSNDVIRVVDMMDITQTNTVDTDIRGTTSQLSQVVHVVYSEQTENEQTVGYLDLQYNQATLYPGADGQHGTNDDVEFKSRTRITGRVTLNSDNEAENGAGDFIDTKYDRSVNDDSTTWSSTTKTMGRGGYEADQYSIFDIDTDITSLSEAERSFCIQHESDTLPSHVEETNCESMETAYAWGDATFPFTLTPSINADFELNDFYEGNDTDLIQNDGSNFTIPEYTTTAANEETN